MNKSYKKESIYLRSSRSFSKRDKYACMALYHNFNLNLDYSIYPKNLKGKRMAVYIRVSTRKQEQNK